MRVNRTTSVGWSYLIPFLLLSAMSTILFGGMKGLLDYRRSVDSDVEVNLATIHFFTKEYVQRVYLRLLTKKPSEKSDIPSFYIFADEQKLDSMKSDLPASGKTRYESGYIKLNNPSLSSSMQFRYRGGLPLHWLYDKKSFRIKLPPFTTYHGERQFNLVNPSTLSTVTDWVSYEMAGSLGLLTPEYFPVRVFVNNATNGLHYFLSRIDESFLRKNHRMPGSIYSGDTIYSPNPFGKDKTGVGEITYRGHDGLPLMWRDERLWEKSASRNAESENDRSDIEKFVEIINQQDPVLFMKEFDTYFDKEKYYKYWALDTLVGTYHHDNFHNHKMYFDPYKGKFEPIEWDVRFWSAMFKSKDLPVYPLLRQVKLNPVLEYERDQEAYKLLNRFSIADIEERIDKANAKVFDELSADPFRQQPDSRFGRFAINKEVPFFMGQYANSIKELKLTYQKRHEFLQKVYDDSLAKFIFGRSKSGDLILTISVSGNSPVEFEPWAVIPKHLRSNITISRMFNGKTSPISVENIERLYPGRTVKKGNVLGRGDNWANLAFGKDRVVPSPLQYQYQVKGLAISDIEGVSVITAKNAITGRRVTIDAVKALPSTIETVSVHPWALDQNLKPLKNVVELSGDIDVLKDRVFTRDQTVKIKPGTVFNLAKNSSLIFYGKVLAEGSKSSPIKFRQKVKGEPWGSIVIQGKYASGSELNYIKVSGGSITKQRLIQYPAQLNVHDVGRFSVNHCEISDNHVGDDALHVSYSKGEISNCRFYNTAFDALDIDIAEVVVSDSVFSQVGNDALDLMTSKIAVHNIIVDGAGDKCISAGEASDVSIRFSQFQHCEIGIAVKDQSRAYLEDSKFGVNKGVAIALYQKNPRYNEGGTIDGRRIEGITLKDISADRGSRILIPEEAFITSIGHGKSGQHDFVSKGGLKK